MTVSLGLDFGEKRIGVAITDEMGSMAMPHSTISFIGRKQVLEELKKLVETYRVTRIVVGLPKTLKNEIGDAAKKVIAHVDWFKENLNLTWILWDERLTTQEIERILLDADMSRERRKEVRDRLAAQRILQSYLDYQRFEESRSKRD
jgi:putative holliday junction resolvase